MPRGRMLRRSISHDDMVCKLSAQAVLLYTWCIPHLDVKGRIYADPHYIKGTVVPYLRYLSVNKVSRCIREIAQVRGKDGARLIFIYGKKIKYIQFLDFFRTQRVNEKKEAPSDIPGLEEFGYKPEEVGLWSGDTPKKSKSKSGATPE